MVRGQSVMSVVTLKEMKSLSMDNVLHDDNPLILSKKQQLILLFGALY